MEMYSKDGCIQRQGVLEVKAHSAAREVILKAEKHPVVKAYLEALKFVEEQQKRAEAKDGPRILSSTSQAKVVPACETDESHLPIIETVRETEDETAGDGKGGATHTKQEEKQNNIVYLPFMTPEVRACARACGMGVEAYIKQVIQFANDAVKNEQARNVILNR